MGSIQDNQSTFDYIVVGGGTAGCALASRLSQTLPHASIALVEAGSDITTHPFTQEPFAVFAAHKSDIDWAYQTVSQPQLSNRPLYSAAGKGLGGGSSINYGGWSRGCKLNYDLWADIVGDESWNYEHMLPYFKKIEAYTGPDAAEHGTDGLMHISSISSDPTRLYNLREPIRAAYASAGFPFTSDGSFEQPIGITEWTENWLDGKRQSSAIAYRLSKTRVTVLTDSPVAKVHIDPSTKRATGIQLTSGTTLHASKEIILSAGTYRTAQLLMLSGVGPHDQLTAHSIPVIHENPHVGSNLHDHPGLYIPYKLTPAASSQNLALGHPDFLTNPSYLKGFPWDFILTGHAPTPSLVPSDIQTPRLTNPSYAHYESFIMYAAPGLPIDNLHLPPTPDGTIIGGVIVGLAITSRGSVTLSSSSATDHPVINSNSLTTPHDLTVMRTALREHLNVVFTSPTLSSLILHDIPPPGYPPLTNLSTDAELDARILGRMQLFFHPAGTAALGSVVDAKLRVMGVQGLRVCDTSVMPVPISAHPQACSYVLAERTAEWIAGEV